MDGAVQAVAAANKLSYVCVCVCVCDYEEAKLLMKEEEGGTGAGRAVTARITAARAGAEKQ